MELFASKIVRNVANVAAALVFSNYNYPSKKTTEVYGTVMTPIFK